MNPEPPSPTDRPSDPRTAIRTSTPTAGALPRDLLEQASRRLGVLALIWAGLWALALVVNNLIDPLVTPGQTIDDAFPVPGNAVAALMIVVSVLLFAYTRHQACDCEVSLNLGLGYEVALAAAIGFLNQVTPNTTAEGVSWICVLVLVHAMVVPTTPLRILAAGLLAASMDPLGYIVATMRGADPTLLSEVLRYALPNYICAGIALASTQIYMGLGRQVQDARELGSYRLGDLLGRGGMGEIFRADHRMLRRPAAVKLIRPDALGHGAGEPPDVIARRFRREAEAAASLHSPHTIALYDFGVTESGDLYYVMELLRGLNLESLVERFGPIPQGRAIHFLRQACESLSEAHAIGLLHRDIKPANLYSCRVGIETDFIKVLDFGLVKALPRSGAEETRITGEHMTTGTPAFMAPELALAEDADHRADIYALGCVAYWLVTGDLVFTAAHPMKVMRAHVDETPAPISTRTELPISADFEAVVAACLAKDPDARPASAADLAARLAACTNSEPWTAKDAERWWRRNLPEYGAAAG
jgi:serine/threonine-protein kinase